MAITLKPHQVEVLKQLDNGKILYGDMGVGKSITAAAYYLENEAPKDVYVITTAKKRDDLDWEAEFAKIGMNVEVQFEGQGKLVVDSWNNLHKYKEVRDAFFIFDEQRVVGYGAWSKAFIKIAQQNRWILLSATPGDTWLDYIPVFIANGFYRNKADFVRQHVEYEPYVKHPKVRRYHGVGKLVRLRQQLLVHMPYERHTTREVIEISVGYDQSTLDKVVKKRWHVYENRPIKNVSEMFSVARKVVNSDSSRLAVVSSLITKHPKLIVFYNFDYELEMLRSLGEERQDGCLPGSQPCSPIPTAESLPNGSSTSSNATSFAVAEWNGHNHDPIPQTDRWLYLVQYTAGSEGWNCVETDAMCFYSLTYSWRQFWQAHGRIDRLNTPFETLKYYVLVSGSWLDKAIWKALSTKKSFNETAFLEKNRAA